MNIKIIKNPIKTWVGKEERNIVSKTNNNKIKRK